MSRFLKFIVHLVVFLLIVCILALAVPPFLGISTITIDSTDLETNLPLGSVTYGTDTPVSSILEGDSVIVQNGNQAYLYRVKEIDMDNSMFTVVDTHAANAEPKAMTLRGNVTRTVFTVWFIGYLLMAIQSAEGMIIIGLGVLFLIILFILAEIWGKDKELPADGQDEDTDTAAATEEPLQPAYSEEAETEPKSKRQLKKEARARQKAEVARLKAESKERRKEEKRRLKAAKKIARTGGFIEDMEPVEAILGLDGSSPAEQAADQAHEELKKEIEAATESSQNTEIEQIPTAEIPNPKKAPEPEAPEQQENQEPAPKENPPQKQEAKIAIPIYTAEELLEKARAAGETPEVIHDSDTGVVLLDYSAIIGNTEEEK